jgi:hypothetical protein
VINGYKLLSEIPVRDHSHPSVDILVSVESEVFKDRAMNLSTFLLVKRNSLLKCKYFEKTCCVNLGHVSSCFLKEIGTFISDFTLPHLGNFHHWYRLGWVLINNIFEITAYGYQEIVQKIWNFCMIRNNWVFCHYVYAVCNTKFFVQLTYPFISLNEEKHIVFRFFLPSSSWLETNGLKRIQYPRVSIFPFQLSRRNILLVVCCYKLR